MNKTLHAFLSRLDKVERASKGRYKACCPAHNDKTPSLSIRDDTEDGRVLVKCFAGCDIQDICRSIGLKLSDLYPRTEQAQYSGLPDWKRRHYEDVMQYQKLIILMTENDQAQGIPISADDQLSYQKALIRVRKIKEVLRNAK